MYFKWLRSVYDIVAFVPTNMIDDYIYDVPVVKQDEILKIDFDNIVLAVETKDFLGVKEKIAGINKSLVDKCVTLDSIAIINGQNIYLKYTNSRQLEVIKELLNASDEEIADYDWMYNKVIKYGLFCFDANTWHKKNEQFNWAVYGLQQIPEEFANFCCNLSKLHISTAAEVGVYRGRSAFFLCAILSRANKNLKYKMIDICDRIDDFELFHKVLPQLEKCIPSTSDDYKGEHFDFVFIDADHSYDASINDYNNMGVNANRMVAFHDIYAHEYDNENGGTVRTWKEVCERTKDLEHLCFSIYPDVWMGIGCIIK